MIRRYLYVFMAFIILVGLVPVTSSAASLDYWKEKFGLFDTDRTFVDISHCNGTYFAGTYEGQVYSSTDGVTWDYSDVRIKVENTACGNDLVVAVSKDGAFEVSSNGTDWEMALNNITLYTNFGGQGNQYRITRTVSFENGTFIATGDNGSMITSTDGTKWVNRSSGTDKVLAGATYGSGKYVVVGHYGTILTSVDLASWTSRTSGTTSHLSDVIFENGKFVAVGADGMILTSPDGLTWSRQTSPSMARLSGIAYGESTFLVVGSDGTILTSSDGISWTARLSGLKIGYYLSDAVYANGMFTIAGSGTMLQNYDPIYFVRYYRNGSTGGTLPVQNNQYKLGDSVTVPGNVGNLVRPGYTFVGWTTKGGTKTYVPGETFLMGPQTVEWFEQWTESPRYTVTYNGIDSTGGTVPVDANTYWESASVTVAGNTGNLTKPGYDLVSWNTAADGNGMSYAPGATFPMGTANMSLFPQWAKTYTVTYSGNGSTGGTAPGGNHAYVPDNVVTVPVNTGNYVRPSYTFANWNTAADGSGTIYAPGATFNMGAENMTLYAQWTDNPRYTVTYDGNGSTGGTVPIDVGTYEEKESVDILWNSGGLVRPGYFFDHWNMSPDGSHRAYLENDTLKIGNENVTLYAFWEENPRYTVRYDDNGSTSGSSPAVDQYEENTWVTVAGNTRNLVRTGNTFTGWNTKADGSGTSYAGGATFRLGAAHMTLYAQWTVNPPGDKPVDPPVDKPVEVPVDKPVEVPVDRPVDPLVDKPAVDLPVDKPVDSPVNSPSTPTPTPITVEFTVITGDTVESIETKVQGALSDEIPVIAPTDKEGHWAEKTMDVFIKLGVLQGYGDQSVKPDADITRAEFAAILSRVFDISGGTANPGMGDVGDHWAKEAIEQLTAAGVLTGYEDGSFKPNRTISLEEMISVISRIVNLSSPEGSTAVPTEAFPDASNSFAKAALIEATRLGLIDDKDANKMDPKSKATRAEALLMILKVLNLNPDVKTLLDKLN
jgi:hypothetical protein